jgi:LVIVD repeat
LRKNRETAKNRGIRTRRLVRALATLAAAAALSVIAGAAYGEFQPLNDLFAVGQGGGDSPAAVPVAHRAEPPFVATPLVPCGPGSHPQPGVDGRVPAGSATHGLNCNITLVGHQGTEGGFKVLRYIDARGHECAFYDTTLMFPLNALNPGAGSEGVAVLDMSNPAHPVQTDTLTTTPMLSPHESLNLSTTRGLLAAVNGNLTTEPGVVSIYDVRSDCRHPVLQANGPYARFGHESGFSPDGRTFYATSTALQSVTAIDVTDPKSPHAIWHGNVFAHGMSLSNDGNRAYIADPRDRGLTILDTSQIQARRPNPQTREISRLTWNSVSIPQNAIPFTENGHPYLLEIDEYDQSTLSPNGDPNMVGAARIIDISDETRPFVVANLRLQVDQPAEHQAARNDPGGNGAPQGYAAHYCNIPTRVDPKVVACSFITSGLRVFDISSIVHPKEIAYFVAPPQPRSENGYNASDFVMSKPAFAADRREIWFSDGTSGFYVLRVAKSVWPQGAPRTRAPRCQARRRYLVRARVPRGARVRSVRATLGGGRVRVVRRRGRYYAVADI